MSELERRHVADAAAYFDRWLEFRLAADRVPGVQAAVLHDDEVLLSAAHGVADVTTGEPLTDRHLCRIADTVGYGSRGETMTFDRDADGSIRSVRGGSGSIAYPVDQFRAAIAGRDRITLGAPIRPG